MKNWVLSSLRRVKDCKKASDVEMLSIESINPVSISLLMNAGTDSIPSEIKTGLAIIASTLTAGSCRSWFFRKPKLEIQHDERILCHSMHCREHILIPKLRELI